MFKWANIFSFGGNDYEEEIISPSRRNRCKLILKNNQLSYKIIRDDRVIVEQSQLGFKLCGENPLGQNLKLIRAKTRNHTGTVELQWGEDRFLQDNYQEIAFYLAEKGDSKRIITMRFRVYDNAVAFRYEIPPQPKFQRISIADELTEFNINLNSIAWKIPAYQPDRYEYNYEKCTVYDLHHSVHTPLTIKTPNGYYLAIHEAALYNYGSMTIKLNQHNHLQSDITPLSDGTKAHLNLPFETPWRLIMIADSAIELTSNRVMYCLNDPPRGDFEWV